MSKRKKDEDFSFQRKSQADTLRMNFKEAYYFSNGVNSLKGLLPRSLIGFAEEELNAFKEPFERAQKKGMKLVINSDFDADGITSAAMFISVMEDYFEDIELIQNNKLTEGYSPLPKKIIKSGGDNTFLVFLDCGIAMPKQDVDLLKENFTEICIIDHHEPQSYIPEVNIVNMKLTRDIGFRDLCTAGMVFTLAHQMFDGKYDDFLSPIAATGTIGDMVPLYDDNAFIAYLGYRRMQRNDDNYLGCDFLTYRHKIEQDKKKYKQFLKQIDADSSMLTQRTDNCYISYTDLAFNIVPALNATSRMKGNAKIGVNALLGEEKSIKYAYELNEQRKLLTNEAKDKVEIFENDYIRIGFLDNKYKTINGLLANKLYQNDKVVIVFAPVFTKTLKNSIFKLQQLNLTKDEIKSKITIDKKYTFKIKKHNNTNKNNVNKFINWTGSMRSPNPNKSCLALLEALQADSNLYKGGGHQPAAGINVLDGDKNQLIEDLFDKSYIYKGIEEVVEPVFEIQFTEDDFEFLKKKWVHIPMGVGIKNPKLKIDIKDLQEKYESYMKHYNKDVISEGNVNFVNLKLLNSKQCKEKNKGIKISEKEWVTVQSHFENDDLKILMHHDNFKEFLETHEARISPSYFNGKLTFNLQ